ncbi:protein-glutamate O-methyltransferase family protein [Nocardia colli]|uniref:Protein-glutamate O-methyltransferase family protein n=1 Tax=Nocardia colli TaxID=2545717 RepID=A0A5N0EB82_9NOCA|nr:damage-control phosphatase ARMT1 family protein [Nocardia colli]KAA8886213.1 protein-glutamate O-methyltransferase family protein [Nocardia colli]
MNLAPPILAGAPGSFAHSVFHERHPTLIDQVTRAHPYPADVESALRDLLYESTRGVIEPLAGHPADGPQWLEWGDGLWGLPWGEAPFLWAESYFYRRLLQSVGYFDDGAWRHIDPFAPTKSVELTGAAVTDEIAALSELTRLDEDSTRTALLTSALWGNRADLSFQLTARIQKRSDTLLVDHSSALWKALEEAADPTVCVIADNAGRELLPDLVFIDHLLTTHLAQRVVLYTKPHPYYVSDATMTDVLATIHRLLGAPALHAQRIGQRLWQSITTDRLTVRTHEYFCAPLSFHDMPDDLAAELAVAAVTILKGDLNYRRLVGDRHWPATTSFDDLTAYFPTSSVALRTLKSDVIVGITAEQVERLDANGEPWRTNGRHALIQASTRT